MIVDIFNFKKTQPLGSVNSNVIKNGCSKSVEKLKPYV